MKAYQAWDTKSIEDCSTVELIRRFNYPNVLIYADPPYLLSTRQMNFEPVGQMDIFREA